MPCLLFFILQANVCRLETRHSLNANRLHVQDATFETGMEISQQGNSSDVRGIALSEDDTLAITCGNAGSKIWDVATGECVNTVDSSYGLSVLFAPGSRFAVLGCKNGKIELISVGAAAVVQQVEAHTSQVQAFIAMLLLYHLQTCVVCVHLLCSQRLSCKGCYFANNVLFSDEGVVASGVQPSGGNWG